MRNIRLTLAYDGTAYVGWQVQPNGVSVQSVVEEAIRNVIGKPVSLLAAGRTDAGVHAIGQVANFHIESSIPCRGFKAGLTTFLPADIVVRTAEDVGLEFHATHDARRKQYRYVIYNARPRYPFLRRFAHEVYAPLDTAGMQEAAQVLVGRHDFRAFESHHPNKATSVRTIFEARVQRHAGWSTWHADSDAVCEHSQAGAFIWIDLVADGFLYNMVRAIAGTLIRVGERKWSPADMRAILESGERRRAGSTAPACGLYLVRVEYDEAAASAALDEGGDVAMPIGAAPAGEAGP
jgi:tRNA pseudouridine38-40 synthase